MAKIRTRKRGKTYSYIFEAGQQNGKRKVIEKGGFPSKEAAYDAGVEAYADWRHGNIGITSDRILMDAFLKRWLENVASLNVRDSTLALYKSVIANRLAPIIGSVAVQDLTPAMLDGAMRELMKRGLAKGTLISTWQVLHQALDYAVYPAQLIQENPSRYIKVPRTAPQGIVKRTIVTREQYRALMEKYPFGTPSHIPIALLYHTGMRIGEVLAVSWDDVDLERGIIHVRRQYKHVRGRGYMLTEPKTASSVRSIRIDENLCDLLRRWKDQQEVWEQELGDAYCVIDLKPDRTFSIHSRATDLRGERQRLLCTNQNGRLINRATVSLHLHSAGLNTHSFRHTHATLLAQEGAPPKGVAYRLGHKNPIVTENIYTHNTDKMQEETLDLFLKSMQTNPGCRQNADKKADKP